MYRKTDEQTRRDPFQDVTDRILEALEAGVKPWVKPWNPDQAAGPQGLFNPTTGRYYRGIKVLILGMDMRSDWPAIFPAALALTRMLRMN